MRNRQDGISAMTMAKSDPAVRRITKQGLPALRMFGLAVEYFPHYLNRTIELHTLDVVLLSFIVRGRGRHLIDDVSAGGQNRPLAGR